jgi:hypothetical protein
MSVQDEAINPMAQIPKAAAAFLMYFFIFLVFLSNDLIRAEYSVRQLHLVTDPRLKNIES